MGFEAQFLQFTTQTVTIEPLSTHTSYGAPTFSTSAAKTYSAYVEPGTRVVRTQRGVEEVATAVVFVMSSCAVMGSQDRIRLHDGRLPKVLRVDINNDDRGQHHLEVSIA